MGYRRNAIEIDGDPINGYRRGLSSLEISKLITANGFYRAADDNARGYKDVDVQVPNTYTQEDDGKVVDNGILVPQTPRIIVANGVYDTTLNDQITANVPNTYTQADEGKVVHGSELVAQTPLTVTKNGVYDTELHTPTTVAIPDFETMKWGLSKPAGITVLTTPDKIDYFVGDTIDYSGIVVGLLDEYGNPYTSVDYPDSIVPFDELVFPTSVCPDYENYGVTSPFDDLKPYEPIPITQSISGVVTDISDGAFTYNKASWAIGMAAFTYYRNFVNTKALYRVNATSDQTISGPNVSYTYLGKKARYTAANNLNQYRIDTLYIGQIDYSITTSGSKMDQFINHLAWTIAYGTPVASPIAVNVNFKNLQTTFNVMVTKLIENQ